MMTPFPHPVCHGCTDFCQGSLAVGEGEDGGDFWLGKDLTPVSNSELIFAMYPKTKQDNEAVFILTTGGQRGCYKEKGVIVFHCQQHQRDTYPDITAPPTIPQTGLDWQSWSTTTSIATQHGGRKPDASTRLRPCR